MRKATRAVLQTVIAPLKDLSLTEKRRRLRERDQWLREVDLLEAFNDLADYMPEYRFFLKRRSGEIMFLSRAMVQTLRAPDEISLMGISDNDVTPGPLADLYRVRDEEVLRTGCPLHGIVEIWFTREGLPRWFLCHKSPLRDRHGRIVGIIGFLKEYHHVARLPVGKPLDLLLTTIHENYSKPLRISDLAEMAHLSVRQVERLFRDALGISPKQYIIKTRVHAAIQLLTRTDLPLAHVALEAGFCDQSSLTYYFRRELGITLHRFRKAALMWNASNGLEETNDQVIA
ncbi:MAG: helix-turn-helix domain-containing protein [Kiritimatiellia bacterium]